MRLYVFIIPFIRINSIPEVSRTIFKILNIFHDFKIHFSLMRIDQEPIIVIIFKFYT